jgi:Domain of unknown function (DUF4838)/Glycosyl hydrolase family 67 N-terminus
MTHRRIGIRAFLALAAVCCTALFLTGCATSEPAFKISKRRSLTIYTPPKPLGVEKLATQELATYLGKMTGVKAKVAELNGKPSSNSIIVCRADRAPKGAPRKELGEQELWLKTQGKTLYLQGGDNKAVLYAAYAFLEEECGVRWLIPGPHGESVPQQEVLAVPTLNRRDKPAFKYRSTMDHKIKDKEMVLWWLLRNRMTLDRGRNRKAAGTRAFYKKLAALGIKPPDVGINRVAGHIFNRTIPAKTWFPKKPEWFPYFNGHNYPGGRNSRQPTLHAEGFIPFITDVIRKGFDKDPSLEIYSLCPNDGFNGWGNHPKDTQWDGDQMWGALPITTDRLMHFASEVANAINESHPGKRVYTYAYTMRYKQPPTRFTDLPENLDIDLVQQYNAHADHLRSLVDPESEANANFRPYVAGWRKAVKGKIVFRTHWCLASSNLIYPTWHTIQDTYKYLADQGIDGVEHGIHRAYGHNGLSIWLTHKLSWNPDADVDKLKRLYCERLYGRDAAPHMETYYDRLKRAALESGVEAAPGGMRIKGLRIFPEQVQTDLDALLTKAEAAAKTDRDRWTVGLVRLGFKIHSHALAGQRKAAVGQDYEIDTDKQLLLSTAVNPKAIQAQFTFDEWVRKQPQGAYVPEVIGGRSRKKLKSILKSGKRKTASYVTLKNDALEVLVTPALRGAIFQVTDLKTGKKLFPGFGGGYFDALGPAFGWLNWGKAAKFEVASKTDTRIELKTSFDEIGIDYTRTYELKGNRIEITATARNVAPKPSRPFIFIIKPLFMIGGRLNGETAYLWQDDAWSKLDFVDNIYSSQWFIKGDRPQGKWAIADGDSGLTVVNHFEPEAVDYMLLWDALTKGNTMEMMSPLKKLQPNEMITFSHAYEVISDRGDMFKQANPFKRVDTTW